MSRTRYIDLDNLEARPIMCIRSDDECWGNGDPKHELKIGQIYWATCIDVDHYHTDIYIKELDDKPFNSVLFRELSRKELKAYNKSQENTPKPKKWRFKFVDVDETEVVVPAGRHKSLLNIVANCRKK